MKITPRYMVKLYRTKRNIYEVSRYASLILNYLNIDTSNLNLYNAIDIDDLMMIDVSKDSRYIRNEVMNMIDKYLNSDDYIPYPYAYKVISLSIVSEVLEHYDISFDIIDLLKQYNISLDEFDKMNDRIRLWAKKNYWKDNIEYYT